MLSLRRWVACLLGLVQLPAGVGLTREYFVRAEEVLWDYGPEGFDGHTDAAQFMVNDPAAGQIGSRYWKCVYREYTDGSFSAQKHRAEWSGLLGPVLRCEVGDRLAISFRNSCTKALTMHPHGLRYSKPFEGAPYNDGADGRGDQVEPGGNYMYLWNCDAASGPGPSDVSSVAWLYHSHNPTRVDTNSGLFGLIIVTRRGDADADARPRDVDVELMMHLSVIDENKNYLLDRNMQFLNQQGHSLNMSGRDLLKKDAYFQEGNLMHGINGRLYGNLKGLSMRVGQMVRWYVFSLGSEVDLHTVSWKGHSVIHNGQRATSVQLMPGVAAVADMLPSEVGHWPVFCAINDHLVGGMTTTYEVQGSSTQFTSKGRHREYYIQAEEVVWDYGPANSTLYNTSLHTDEYASVFFKPNIAQGHIGGKYLKCLYVGYTDATFTSALERPPEWQHLGMLGPLIRGEVGDTIQVTYSNTCSKATSINVPAVLKPKTGEGLIHGEEDRGQLQDSKVVEPGGRCTYTWQVVDGPGPLDLSSVAFVYHSDNPMHTDTNSGLIGLLIISDFGRADDTGKPLDVEHELAYLLTVTDEGESYLLDSNIERFVLDSGGNFSTADIERLKDDETFKESNLMHGINGFLFGTMQPPRLIAGQNTRVYAFAVGTEVDMHSFRLQGHSFLIQGQRRAQLNLMPYDVVEADFLPTSGTWAVHCQTNDHFAAGMINLIDVSPSLRDDPLSVSKDPVGKIRRYYIRAEEVVWSYATTGFDQTQQGGPAAWENSDGADFIPNKPASGLIGPEYIKCLYIGYDSTFSIQENRSMGSRWQHLGNLGPVMHAEVGDQIQVELRNSCTISISIHPQLAMIEKAHEGFRYQDANGAFLSRPGDSVEPGGRSVYTWHVTDGPGPRDGSSIGTMYYSQAQGMVLDLYSGLKGPLVITRRGFADADGRPRDVETELILMFEVTDEGQSFLLNQNVAQYVTARGGQQSKDTDQFQESNRMNGINGHIYANLPGLVVRAETNVRWYVMSLGTETDLHPVHWHGHSLLYGGHRLDVVMGMPATGITADMYVENVGTWLVHCHVNKHMEHGMVGFYTVMDNIERSEAQISTCQQMYGQSADSRRESFMFSTECFEGHMFQVTPDPYFKIAYTVNYTAQHIDMCIAARTTGWLGLGFYSRSAKTEHAMINTDMVMGRVKQGVLDLEDCYAMGLETPKLDKVLGAADQLSMKNGWEENGVTYLQFRRSFMPHKLDEYDFAFTSSMHTVDVVYAYSSVNSDNFVYHGPTRGFAQLPWNLNCSDNLYFNLQTSSCEGCDRGSHRIASDSRYSATACARCPLGTFADLPGNLRSEACTPCGIAHGTTIFPGATSYEDCMCEPNYYHPCQTSRCFTSDYTKAEMLAFEEFCAPCPKGMTCLGGFEAATDAEMQLHRKHQQPIVPKGFFSTAEKISVFRCHKSRDRCPGGAPGICALGREGIQCGKCKEGWTSGGNGACRQCQTSDGAIAVVGSCLAIAVLGFLYKVLSKQNRKQLSQSMLLVIISACQLVTIIQVLGIVSLLKVEMGEPLASILDVVGSLYLNIEGLHLECLVGAVDGLMLLLLKLGIIVSTGVLTCILHFLHVRWFDKGRIVDHMPRLILVLGNLQMLYFPAVSAVVLAPFQCSQDHPNGKTTINSFPTVTCWEGESHKLMVVVGVVSSILPFTFLSMVAYAVWSYPRKVFEGSVSFLITFSFAFRNFRPEVYWFGLFLSARNLLISVVPCIPGAMEQVFAMQLLIVASTVLVVHFKPNRIWQANLLEVSVSVGIVVVIGLMGFFVDDVPADSVNMLFFGVVVLIAMFTLVAMVYGVAQTLLRAYRGKHFSHFICHHRAAAGTMARLLKMSIKHQRGEHRDVFVDIDNLTNLDNLFGIVANDTETLVCLCSDDIFRRPWCVGEIATAKTSNVQVIKILFPGVLEPDNQFIDTYESNQLDLSELAGHGISAHMIKDTLRWLRCIPGIRFAADFSLGTVNHMARIVTNKACWRPGIVDVELEFSTDGFTASHSSSTAVLVDESRVSNLASAYIFLQLLQPHFAHKPEAMPFMHARSSDIPSTTQIVLLLCTTGVFEQSKVLRQLVKVVKTQARLLPIWIDEQFEIPNLTFEQDHIAVVATLTEEPHVLSQYIKDAFKEIAIAFNPLQYSEEILATRAEEVANRLMKWKWSSSKQAPSSVRSLAHQFESDSSSLTVLDELSEVPDEEYLTAIF